MTEYQVIEDNGGNLFIFVIEGDEVVRGIENLEYLSHEDFMASITSLKEGDDARTWEGQIENPAEAHENLTSSEYGWMMIANEKKIFPQRMGRAGMLAFGIEED